MKYVARLFIISGLLALQPAAIAANCGVGATAPSFGTTPQNQESEPTGTLTVTCSATMADLSPPPTGTNGTISYSIELSSGSSGNVSLRHMTRIDGPMSQTLSYNLYCATDYAIAWGNGLNGSCSSSGTLTFTAADFSSGMSQSTTKSHSVLVYGRVLANDSNQAIPGQYHDIVMVTVDY